MTETTSRYKDADQEIKEILQRSARTEEGMKAINEKLDNVIAIRDKAIETEQSVKSAHHRLDGIEDTVLQMNKDFQKEKQDSDNMDKLLTKVVEGNNNAHQRLNKMDKIVFWAGSSVIITLLGVVVALIKIFLGGQ